MGTFQPNADVFIDEEGGGSSSSSRSPAPIPRRCASASTSAISSIAGAPTAKRRDCGCGSFVQKEIAHGEFVKRIPLPVAVEYEARCGELRGRPADRRRADCGDGLHADRANRAPRHGKEDAFLEQMAQKPNNSVVPANLIGILPLQEAVLFPHTVIPLAVVKKPGIQLVEEALREGKPIGLVVLRIARSKIPVRTTCSASARSA